MTKKTLHLFEAYGIELEYMLVDKQSYNVRPIADQLLQAEHGSYDDVERGSIAWSNELVTHVIELKTNGPAPALSGLPAAFQADVQHINRLLQPLQACLMPSAMHPFMRPQSDTQLWPHAHNAVYETFNSIFNCHGHGWSNLQSTHLNLPFAGDAEFGALHAAIRLLLPIMPALSASSPIYEGRLSGMLDSRMQFYRDNAQRIPSLSGALIPEAVYTRKDYETHILARLYQDLAPYDPQGQLQHEWANARAAIARFDRDAIEIRLLDVQECPLADISIVAAIVGVLQALVAQRWSSLASQQAWPTQPLKRLLNDCMRHAHATPITDAAYLAAFHYPGTAATAAALWQHLLSNIRLEPIWQAPLQIILSQGPLAQRVVQAVGKNLAPAHVRDVYQELCTCLQDGHLFTP